jgi:hypothetical protein
MLRTTLISAASLVAVLPVAVRGAEPGAAPSVALSGVPARAPWSDRIRATVTVINPTSRTLRLDRCVVFLSVDARGKRIEAPVFPFGDDIMCSDQKRKVAARESLSFQASLPWCEVESDPCLAHITALVYRDGTREPLKSNVLTYALDPNPAATFRTPYIFALYGLADNAPAMVTVTYYTEEAATVRPFVTFSISKRPNEGSAGKTFRTSLHIMKAAGIGDFARSETNDLVSLTVRVPIVDNGRVEAAMQLLQEQFGRRLSVQRYYEEPSGYQDTTDSATTDAARFERLRAHLDIRPFDVHRDSADLIAVVARTDAMQHPRRPFSTPEFVRLQSVAEVRSLKPTAGVVEMEVTQFGRGTHPVSDVSFAGPDARAIETYDASNSDVLEPSLDLRTASDRPEVFALAVVGAYPDGEPDLDPYTAAFGSAARRASALAAQLGAQVNVITLAAVFPSFLMRDGRTGFPAGAAFGMSGGATIATTAEAPLSPASVSPQQSPSPDPVPITVPDAARTVVARADEHIAWPADRLWIDITVGRSSSAADTPPAAEITERLRARPDVEDVAAYRDPRLPFPIRFEVIARSADTKTASAIVDALHAVYGALPIIARARGAVQDCFAASLAAQQQSADAALQRAAATARRSGQRLRTLVLAAAGLPHAEPQTCAPRPGLPRSFEGRAPEGLTVDANLAIAIDVPVTLTYRTYERAKPDIP